MSGHAPHGWDGPGAAERATLERVWQRLEVRLDRLEAAPMVAAQHRRRSAARAGGLALAAAVALVVALAVVVPAGVGARGLAGAALPPPQDLSAQVAPSPERVALQAQSAAMESWLAALPRQRVVRGRSGAATLSLEDGIAVIDDHLADHAEGRSSLAPELVDELWRRRVRLLASLAEVRYADTAVRRL